MKTVIVLGCGVLILMALFGSVVAGCGNSNSNAPKPAAGAEGQPESQARTYTDEQRKAASEAMALINKDCKIYEEGPHLVVEMKMFLEDKNQRLEYVQAIANSDCVLYGTPRNIYFYDPSGKKIAQADTLSGIRLLN